MSTTLKCSAIVKIGFLFSHFLKIHKGVALAWINIPMQSVLSAESPFPKTTILSSAPTVALPIIGSVIAVWAIVRWLKITNWGKIGNLLPGPNQNPAHRSNVPAVEQKTQRTGSFAAAAAHAWPAKHKPVTGIPLLFISALLLAVEFPHMASPMGILMEVRILMKKWAA